jgi:hypothetical protein
LKILDRLVLTMSLSGGAMLGRLVLGNWLSGAAVEWLGMSLGGSLGLIAGSFVYSRFHPQHWLRRVESRIVEMLIMGVTDE